MRRSSSHWTACLDLFKLLGFTLCVLFAFLAGVYWATHHLPGSSRLANPAAARRSEPQRTAEWRPEDFYPAAEFRQQAAMLLGCYGQLNTNPELYANIAKALAGRLAVFGLVASEDQAHFGVESMAALGVPSGAIRFIPLAADSIWIRDYGPFMLRRRDNMISLIDARYLCRDDEERRTRDEDMSEKFASLLDLPLRSIPIVLEGGNALSNGDGALLVSSQLLLANERYGYTKSQISDILSEYLGVNRWSYVPPLEGESTGHIDMFCVLLGVNLLVVGEISPEVDPVNSDRLDVAASHFSQVITSLGPMQVFRIPMPLPWGDSWRSYTNVILANGILLMPSFKDVDPELEQKAESLYKKLLPSWEVKRIPCDTLVKEGGLLHCISYNVPRYVSLDRLDEMAFPQPFPKEP